MRVNVENQAAMLQLPDINGNMDDEDWVDWSIPSSPMDHDDHENAQSPELGQSSASETETATVKVEPLVESEEREESTVPLREINRDTPENPIPVIINPDAEEEEDRVDVEEKQCRICFLGVEEEGELGRLISPCLCAGSMRYCHIKCLQAWRGTGSNAKAFMECPQCHHQYRLRRTLVSGLATSKPLLLLLTSILFFFLALIAGEIVIVLVTSSSLFAALLLPSDTPVETIMDALAEGEDGGVGGVGGVGGGFGFGIGPVFVFSGGGTFMYEVVSSAIGAALEIADAVAGPADAEWSVMGEFLLEIGLRFALGLALLGSLSFISLLFSLSLFMPLQAFNHLRGTGWLGTLGGGGGRRRNDTANQGAVGRAIALVVILVGVINTIVQVYDTVKGLTQRLLMYVETQILEVNPEERRQAREKAARSRDRAQAQGQLGWARRWWEERRWRRMRGWYELYLRAWVALREKVRAVARG